MQRNGKNLNEDIFMDETDPWWRTAATQAGLNVRPQSAIEAEIVTLRRMVQELKNDNQKLAEKLAQCDNDRRLYKKAAIKEQERVTALKEQLKARV